MCEAYSQEGAGIFQEALTKPLSSLLVSFSLASIAALKMSCNCSPLSINITRQSLSNQTPDQVHESAQGGGAIIVDKFSDEKPVPEMMAESGQRRAAACEVDSAT